MKKTQTKSIQPSARIEYRPIALLRPNLKNPRKPKDKNAIKELAADIKSKPGFFEARAILLSDRTGELVIIGGQRRYEAAQLLGMEQVPTILLSGLSEAAEDEIMIKDNTHAGIWDEEKLAQWDKQQLQSWNVEGVKWPVHKNSNKEDDFNPDKKVKARCKAGELYELGNHRLMCGDTTDLQSVRTLMGGVLSDMVFTDPPYGVAIGSKNEALDTIQRAGCCTTNIENDTLSVEDLYKVLQRAFENIRLNSKDDASYYVAAPPGGDMGLMMMMMMMQDAGLRVRHQLVWNKNCATFSIGRLDYDYKHEALLYTWTKTHHNYRQGAFRTSVWDIDKPRKCDLHPTMKPVELVVNCLLDGTKEGDVVLDGFGGSGTTIIACEQLHRKARVMELDPHYCDVIITRWEEYTGKKAVKINTP